MMRNAGNKVLTAALAVFLGLNADAIAAQQVAEDGRQTAHVHVDEEMECWQGELRLTHHEKIKEAYLNIIDNIVEQVQGPMQVCVKPPSIIGYVINNGIVGQIPGSPLRTAGPSFQIESATGSVVAFAFVVHKDIVHTLCLELLLQNVIHRLG